MTDVRETDISATDARPVLVMVHGWPDTAELWTAQLQHFGSSHRCIALTLPGFARTDPRVGHSLEAVVQHLAQTVDQASPDRPVVLMLHDWGCFFGYAYAQRHPHRVERIVAIDVGDAHSAEFRRGLRLREGLLIAGYQLWLVLAWRLRRIAPGVADGMTRWLARAMGCRAVPASIHAGMNYPYDITWTRSHGGYRGLPALQLQAPMFYAWGARKPMQFHSRAWIERLAARPGCHVQRFDSGHWVMRQRADAFNAAVSAWLAAPRGG